MKQKALARKDMRNILDLINTITEIEERIRGLENKIDPTQSEQQGKNKGTESLGYMGRNKFWLCVNRLQGEEGVSGPKKVFEKKKWLHFPKFGKGVKLQAEET